MTQVQTISSSRWAQARLGILLFSFLLWALPSQAATTIDLATGVAAGIGIAADPINSNVYYVEFNGGTLKKIHINAGCDLSSPATCTITTLASGFTHPEDVALDVDHGVAYVITCDDLGTTGAIWPAGLASCATAVVPCHPGAPNP